MGNGPSRTITLVNDDPSVDVHVSKHVLERLREGEPKENVEPKSATRIPTNVAFQESSTSSMEILKIKEAELQAQDAYWRKRIENLVASHNEVNRILGDEYNKAQLEMQELFQEPSERYSSPPCTKQKELITKCYTENPKQPLLCAKLASEYASCVDSHRIKRLQTRR